MKLCHKCNTEKPLTEFYRRTYKSGEVKHQSKCKSCQADERRYYYKPHQVTRRKLKISEEEYTTLMEKSQEGCEVCSRPLDKICIDHCHTTGKVRGVLCNNCNTALGLVGDNVATLTKLIQYLEQSRLQE